MFTTNETTTIHRAELPDNELRAMAPAVFAQSPMPGTSTRYSFLPTSRIIDAMRAEGWKPTDARQSRPRLAARQGYQLHQVRFQRRDQLAEVGEFAPEVVLINSHDRSSGYELHAGLFRFICRNGMMVSDAVITPIHVRHTGQELPQIIDASFKILAQLPVIAGRVASFRSRMLTDAAAMEFATHALRLRYPDPTLAPIRADQLLDVRRSEDAGMDLWSIVSRCQEALLRGGMRDTSRVNRAGKPFRPMRPIRGLDANVHINLGLWQLAEAFRQN